MSRCCARQSERCREILKRLTSLSTEGEAASGAAAASPRWSRRWSRRTAISASPSSSEPGERSAPEPVGRRNPGVIYGLGNLVENAVDFARETVTVRWRWNDAAACAFEVIDDGAGFPPEVIDRIGEPYMSTRQGAEPGGGLGLGLFIAKTLLERSGRNTGVPQRHGARQGRHGAGDLAARRLPTAPKPAPDVAVRKPA